MKWIWTLVFLTSIISTIISQGNHIQLEGEWMLADLDNSVVSFYKGTDGFWYSKILKSDKAVYVNQVIFKGKQAEGKTYYEGTFTTPKSKMNIATKIYLDNNHQMRFIGKKYFITKTYIGHRVK